MAYFSWMVESLSDLLCVSFQSGDYLFGGVVEHHGRLVVTASYNTIRIGKLDVHSSDACDAGRMQTLEV